jgi:3-hydroxyisobutyrate dehydrogenase
MSLTLGWIGTGIMGRSMCGHLLAGGYPVTVHSRTRAKADPLVEQGARWAGTPVEAARDADVVFTMVGFPDDVRQVYLGPGGIVAAARPGAVLVDMTTTEPSLAVEIAAQAAGRGVATVDAPVSGGDVGARNAALSIMVGGDTDAVGRVRPLLDLLGRNIVHQGGPGAGQHTKMCNQIVIAGTMIGVCESLLYGARAGLDLETMLGSIRSGAAGCWTLENLAPRVLKRNFAPGFFVEHFLKDMGIALAEARRMKLALPGLALVHQLYVAVQAEGHGRLGTHALMLALERMNSGESSA